MPRVPTFDQPQVKAQGLPGVRQNIAAPDSAFGTGKALSNLGGSIGQSADNVNAFLKKRAEEDNDALAWNAYTEFSNKQRDFLYGPEKGIFNTRGADALGASSKGAQELGKMAQEISGTLTSPEAQQKFQKLYARSMDSTLDSLSRHESEQRRTYLDQTAKGVIATASQDAAVKWNDPKYIDNSAELAVTALRGNLLSKGTAPELIDAEAATMRSGVWKSALAGAIEANPLEAKRLLDENRGKLTGEDSLAIDKALEVPLRAARASAIAGQVVQPGAKLPGNISQGIAATAQKEGVDVATMLTIAKLENAKGDPNAKNPKSSAHGIFQFIDGTWVAMGGTAADRGDVNKQIEMGVKLTKQNGEKLSGILGRQPAGWELYLAHQQGAGGAAALLAAAPGEKAVDVLARVNKNPADAMKAVVNNGGSADMTAAQFAKVWEKKYARAAMGASEMTLSDRINAAQALAGDDKELGKAAVAEVTAQYNTEKRAREDERDAALEQVYGHVLQTGSYVNAPKAALSKLDNKTLLEIQEKAKNTSTDWAFYDNYMSLSPEKKAAVPLSDLMSHLGPTEMRAAIKERNDGKEGTTKAPWLQERSAIVKSFAQEAGVIPMKDAKISDKQKQAYNALSEYMNKKMDEYRKEKGTEMPEAQFRQEAARAVTKVVTPSTGGLNALFGLAEKENVFALNGRSIKSIGSVDDVPATLKSDIESRLRSDGYVVNDALVLSLARARIVGDRSAMQLILNQAKKQ